MEERLLRIKAARTSVSPSDSHAGSWWVDLLDSLAPLAANKAYIHSIWVFVVPCKISRVYTGSSETFVFMTNKIISVTSVPLQRCFNVIFMLVRLLIILCSSKALAQAGASATTVGVNVMVLYTQTIPKDKIIEIFKLISRTTSSVSCWIRLLVKVNLINNSTKIKGIQIHKGRPALQASEVPSIVSHYRHN